MKITQTLLIATAVLGLSAFPATAQEKHTEHTVKLAEGAQSGAGKIEDATWLAGRWTGTGLGGWTEETWAPPHNGVMLGTFRFVKDDKPVFYEFMMLTEKEGTLLLRLKHFHPDLVGWEEKDKWMDFKYVGKSGNALQFNGLTFIPDGERGLLIYLALRNKDGLREEVFRMTRQ